MRENNRNSIARLRKCPQITTMNVIDGQAGQINCASLIFYSLTIDNILNIIVLLILAGISIAMLSGDNSILRRVVEAKELNEAAINSNVENISKTTSYVGYYADLDLDNEVDGIIFADLAIGGSGQFSPALIGGNSDTDGDFTILPQTTNLKDYFIESTSYTGDFGTSGVIAPNLSSSGNNERFYIMSLNDISDITDTVLGLNVTYWWYDFNLGEYKSNTSTDFAEGRNNTEYVLDLYDDKYASTTIRNSEHIWKSTELRNLIAENWFVPSRDEWSAFGVNLGITNSNYTSKGLSSYYWVSSMSHNSQDAWSINFVDMWEGSDPSGNGNFSNDTDFKNAYKNKSSTRVATTF